MNTNHNRQDAFPLRIFTAAAVFLAAAILLSCGSVPETTDTAVYDDSLTGLLSSGKIDELKRRLTETDSVNQTNGEGQTLLHLAALRNDGGLVEFLLTLNPDTEIRDNAGNTPFAAAAENGCWQAAAALAAGDAYLFAKNNGGLSVYDLAEAAGTEGLDAVLSVQTAEQQDAMGRTALHLAAAGLNTAAAEILAGRSANLSVRDLYGKTALDYAYENPGDERAAEIASLLLLSGAEPVHGKFSYFETAVLKRNLSMRFHDGETPLHIAAGTGACGFVRYLIDHGAQINAKDAASSSPLHEAVRSGETACARMLIEAGADVNARDSSGNTPLHLVMPAETRRSMFDLLLGAGANPNLKDVYGETPLHIAARITMSRDIIQRLVDAGADLNERNKKGNTPLTLSIERSQIQQANFFVTLGSDIHAETIDESTAFTKALESGLPMTQAVLIKENIHSRDSAGRTPLHIAVTEQAPAEIIQYILSLGADVNAHDKNGNTALHTAAAGNFKQNGEILLAAGADVFSPNVAGESVLHIALTRLEGREDWILNSDIIKSADGAGNTPLHFAAQWNLVSVIPQILEKGGDINARNSSGETPLFNAARADSPEMIAALLSANHGPAADLNARNFLGDSVLYSGIRWHARNSVSMLIDTDVRTNNRRLLNAKNLAGRTVMHEAAASGDSELLRMVLQAGADVNAADETGATPLMDAVNADNFTAVEMLLAYHASPMIQNMYGLNAFHVAAMQAGEDVIILLREAGADPMSRDAYGKTPLAFAFERGPEILNAVLYGVRTVADSDGNTPLHLAVEENAPESVFAALLERGFPLDYRNRQGITALQLALNNGNEAAMRILLAAGADPFLTDAEGASVVSIVLSEKTACVPLLSEYAAERTDARGDGLLHYAARVSSPEVVQQIRQTRRTDPYARNIEGETPADVAARWKRPDIQALLQ